MTTSTITRSHTTSAADYIAACSREGARFASVAEAGDWDAPIAACPGWDLRELVRHVGLVHLWAATNLRYPSDRWLSVTEMADLAPYWPNHTSGWPADDGLVEWYRSTLMLLIDVLAATADDHECLTFVPAPTARLMWARRQASEIAIHRFDAESAVGRTSSFEPEFAADMLDELLVGFAPRMRARGVAHEHVLRLVAQDVGDQYTVTIGPDGIRTDTEADVAGHHLEVVGTAADLYVLMWNRPSSPTIRLTGDERVLDIWRETCRIEWR